MEQRQIVKVVQHGGGLGITIPSNLVEFHGLEKHDLIEIAVWLTGKKGKPRKTPERSAPEPVTEVSQESIPETEQTL